MFRLICWLAFCALLLGACTPHRTRTAEPLPLPETFSSAESAAEEAERDWWLSFADPELNRIMDRLFAANLSLRQGHARLVQAELLARQASAFRYPTLTGAGQFGESSQPSAGGSSRGESSQLSVSASYELDLLGKLASRDRAAVLRSSASYEDLQTLYMSLSAQLADLYYLAIEQRSQLALADATIANYADSLQRVEERYRQGIAAAVDVYQARQNLATAQANRLSFSEALNLSENAIAVLLGDYPGTQVQPQQAEIPAAPPRLPTGIPAELLQNRPDLRAALLRVAAQDAEVAAAIADRFPNFTISGAFGTSRSDLTGNLISGSFWNYLLRLSQPLFDAGRRKAEVARNQALYTEAVAAYQEQVLRSVREVEDALVSNVSTAARIQRLEERTAAAAAAERLALENYLNGLSDYLPVLSNQIFHFNAQSQLLTARRQLLSHRISLARALGGSWMQEALEQQRAALKETKIHE